MTQSISELKEQLTLDSANLEAAQASIREALANGEQARKAKRDVAGQVKTQIFQRNELEHEVKVQ